LKERGTDISVCFSLLHAVSGNLQGFVDVRLRHEEVKIMKKIIKIMTVLVASVVVFSPLASAQRPLPDPGITPDSPFYFIETFVDRFRSPERVADRKAAEMIAMAEENNVEALERAEEQYNRAMERAERRAGDDADQLEENARQASDHMAHLATASERVPEEAREETQKAIENSARARERAIEGINRTDPERAENVAESTLQEVMANTPEEAQEGLQTAIENVSEERGMERIGPPVSDIIEEDATEDPNAEPPV